MQTNTSTHQPDQLIKISLQSKIVNSDIVLYLWRAGETQHTLKCYLTLSGEVKSLSARQKIPVSNRLI